MPLRAPSARPPTPRPSQVVTIGTVTWRGLHSSRGTEAARRRRVAASAARRRRQSRIGKMAGAWYVLTTSEPPMEFRCDSLDEADATLRVLVRKYQSRPLFPASIWQFRPDRPEARSLVKRYKNAAML